MTTAPGAELGAFKERQRVTWAAGAYADLDHRLASAGEEVVARTGIGADDEVLDVGCGPGNATIPAARAARRVVGLDLTPELLAIGRDRARAAGVEIEWVEGDAEALPFPDASFDVVVSTFGSMFAPRHRVAAGEMARVLRAGGRLGVASWTPEGNIGGFFRTIAAHMPPPPAFAEPPLGWGTEEHVGELFAGTGVELEFSRAAVEFGFDSVAAAVDEFETKFGPILMARAALEPQGRWEAARDDLVAFFRSLARDDGSLAYEGEYLLVVGRKRSF